MVLGVVLVVLEVVLVVLEVILVFLRVVLVVPGGHSASSGTHPSGPYSAVVDQRANI